MTHDPARLTASQRRLLLNLLAGEPAGAHLWGNSQHGGFTRTLAWARRNGYMTADEELTPAGRALAEQLNAR